VNHPRSSPASGLRKREVPLLDLARQYAQIREEVRTALDRVCQSHQFILGPEVEQFEQELAACTGVTTAVGCSSGTDALWLALLALGIQPGDRVVTTAFSFFASGSAIVRAAARPVFADIDPQTFNIDAACVGRLLREDGGNRIRALLPVHLYGQCAGMDALGRLAEEWKIPILEDAAQAIGARWHDRPAGSLGAVAAFSFYPTKNLSAYGEAGAVTTSDEAMAERMRRLRTHGSPRRYLHEEFGWNCRLDGLQAAVLRVKMRYMARWNEQRRERAAAYDRLFAQAGLGGTSSPVQLPFRDERALHVFHQYVIRAQRRDELRSFLAEHGIGTEIYYPIPLHLQPCFAYLGYRQGDFPEAERAAREVLALPMFPELTEEEQKYVVEAVAEFYS
jgi:dTDP-4-amino-4,6-dideoxygalactose transaminase